MEMLKVVDSTQHQLTGMLIDESKIREGSRVNLCLKGGECVKAFLIEKVISIKTKKGTNYKVLNSNFTLILRRINHG
jgi:hypothetical protein